MLTTNSARSKIDRGGREGEEEEEEEEREKRRRRRRRGRRRALADMTDKMKITPIKQHPGMSIPTDNPKMADKEKKKNRVQLRGRHRHLFCARNEIMKVRPCIICSCLMCLCLARVGVEMHGMHVLGRM